MRNFFAYRLPDSDEIVCSGSDRLLSGFNKDCFIAASFDQDSIISIPHDYQIGISQLQEEITCASYDIGPYKFPELSTTREEHSDEIDRVKEFINGDPGKKVVATRVICAERNIDIYSSFMHLCEERKSAFIFLFHTPFCGTWLGASPELLLSDDGTHLETMSLAGTRKAGADIPWSRKNLDEQSIVTRYIASTFLQHGLSPVAEPLKTVSAGDIEHLQTGIKAFKPAAFSFDSIRNLLNDLSPTPALCGFPVEDAMDIIHSCENFNRAWYGGYCGPVYSDGRFIFHVILRSFWINRNSQCFFAGGGITDRSDNSDEWNETERKYRSIYDKMIFNRFESV